MIQERLNKVRNLTKKHRKLCLTQKLYLENGKLTIKVYTIKNMALGFNDYHEAQPHSTKPWYQVRARFQYLT